MLQSARELWLPAAQARLLLLLNHVVSREDAAVSRLKGHAGRRLTVEVADVPPWLPALPPMRVTITAAGLFDLDAAGDDVPDLSLKLPLPRPEQLLAAVTRGALPEVRVDGAAALAADMHWLADNLRWDIETDLAQLFGPLPARLVMSAGRGGAQALRRAFPGPAAP